MFPFSILATDEFSTFHVILLSSIANPEVSSTLTCVLLFSFKMYIFFSIFSPFICVVPFTVHVAVIPFKVFTVIIAVPAPTIVTSPYWLTFATFVLEDDHIVLISVGELLENVVSNTNFAPCVPCILVLFRLIDVG